MQELPTTRPTDERDALLSLQQTAGNAAVSQLIMQRDIGDFLGDVGAAIGKALSPALKVGDTGPAVLSLQQLLNRRGAAVLEDSDFGPATRTAVLAFRADAGLPASGSVDEVTWTALRTGGASAASAAPGLATGETWTGMSDARRADFTLLGYTAASWKSHDAPVPTLMPWDLLPDGLRAAATRLGYTPDSWAANRDATARTGAAAEGAEEARAKRKAGPGTLPAKYIGSLRARSILKAEYGGYVDVQLPKIHLLSASEMKSTYEGIYGAGSYTPINGFTVKPDIYLNEGSIWAGTTVHESLHIQEHSSWDAFAYSPTTSFGEGATTVLTEQAMTNQGRAVTHHPYASEVSLMRKMAGHAGMDKLKDAYFKGATADFQAGVSSGLTTGTTWAQFRALVDAGTLAAAQAKLK